MGMTMSQKILAAHAGLDSVVAGQLISAELDLVLANDITGPVAIKEFKKSGAEKVAKNEKIGYPILTVFSASFWDILPQPSEPCAAKGSEA